MTELHQDIIPNNVIDHLVSYYWKEQNKHHTTQQMQKLSNPWIHPVRDLLEPILSDIVDTSECLGDNFYYHDRPYFPHSDYHNTESINVVIPLWLQQKPQKFIVFDQWLDDEGRTFTGPYDLDFKHNVGSPGPISNYQIKNIIADFDEDFYSEYLKEENRPKELFYGLSGNAFSWKPGSILIFNSRMIHCSGRMNGPKLGLTLRFAINNNNWRFKI